MSTTIWTPDNPAPPELRAFARQQVLQKKINDKRVALATGDLVTWLTNFTKTKNPHWQEQGLASAVQPFPDKPYFRPLAYAFETEPRIFVEKSREMMLSWLIAGFGTLHAMRTPMREVVVQTQKEDKVIEFIDYCRTLYEEQPQWLKDAHPLIAPFKNQAATMLEFRHGGRVKGIPGGADQVRSEHPWLYISDEAAFQPEAGSSYDNAVQVSSRVIVNSTAGPGWFGDVTSGIDPMEL